MRSATTIDIYGLCDPRTGHLRYVGQSRNALIRRYQHVCTSQLVKRSHKNYWIKQLLNDGVKPEMFVIESVPAEQWEESEKFWIAYFKTIGADLTNSTGGGEGGYEFTPDVREKIGAASRGKTKTFSEEHKAKIAAANRERAKNPEWIARMRDILSYARSRSYGHRWSDTSRNKLRVTRRLMAQSLSEEQRKQFALSGLAARVRKYKRDIQCKICNALFIAVDLKAKYCSGKCKQRAHRARMVA